MYFTDNKEMVKRFANHGTIRAADCSLNQLETRVPAPASLKEFTPHCLSIFAMVFCLTNGRFH